MLRIDTSLVGMDSIVQQLDKCLDNPPHIFLVGFPGTGKSTIAKDFIKAYFKKAGVSKKEESEYCVEISSHQDRGIHTFRQILNDHVRWIAPRKGVYRWIIIDDCDTLPAISQQALRRPMETFDHITRFLFISQNQESLITPLQSRCHIILIEPSTGSEVYTEILRREGFPKDSYTEEAYSELIMLSLCSVMKFQSLAKMLYSLKITEGWKILNIDYIKKSFDPHIWGSMKELLDNLMESKWEQAQKQMYKIWELGYSFEDILFELEHNIIVMNVVDHRAWYNVQQFLIKSWIYHSQSRSSILDLMTACNEVRPWGLVAGENS
uniref:AAA+ ATPase domain-containing protein n=1 Tax=viral metagenome TaxID=1070528 RepID=A0A6C0ANY8_9ZZZZ